MRPLQRVTASTTEVLSILLEAPDPIWGLQIVKSTGRYPGTIYPILERLESSGWITGAWDTDSDRKGPRRRFYTLNPEARAAAEEFVVRGDSKIIAQPSLKQHAPTSAVKKP